LLGNRHPAKRSFWNQKAVSEGEKEEPEERIND
jgi:hypothetical protein